MKKTWMFALLFFLGSVASAEVTLKAVPAGAVRMKKKESLHVPQKHFAQKAFLALVGTDLRQERNQDQQMVGRSLMNYSLGFEWTPFLGVFEWASFSESTRVGNLSVDRKFQSAFAWALWQPSDYNLLTPFFGIGLGGLQESVTTTLSDQSAQDQSPWREAGGATVGLRLWPRSHFWVSAEGRILKSPYLDPDPTLSAVMRIGLVLW